MKRLLGGILAKLHSITCLDADVNLTITIKDIILVLFKGLRLILFTIRTGGLIDKSTIVPTSCGLFSLTGPGDYARQGAGLIFSY